MLFMDKETGEIVEILLKSIAPPVVQTATGVKLYPMGEIAVIGNAPEGLPDFPKERFEFLGFL